jgi:hypothetical protein
MNVVGSDRASGRSMRAVVKVRAIVGRVEASSPRRRRHTERNTRSLGYLSDGKATSSGGSRYVLSARTCMVWMVPRKSESCTGRATISA